MRQTGEKKQVEKVAQITLLVTQGAKVNMEVNSVNNKKKVEIFLEIFKPVGKTSIEIGGKPKSLPVFAQEGKKDSLIAKISIDELAVFIEGVNRFLAGGKAALEDLAKRVNRNDNFKNLLFSHGAGGRLAGIACNGEDLQFQISEKSSNKYYTGQADLKSLIGIRDKLVFLQQKAIETCAAPYTKKGKDKDNGNYMTEDFGTELEPF